MTYTVHGLVRAAIVTTIVGVVACTANVQDLGTPNPPSAPLVTEKCKTSFPEGDDCTGAATTVCDATETLKCVCGFEGKWVCLDGSLGVLTSHALTTGAPCGLGAHYSSTTASCSCDVDGTLLCEHLHRVGPESEHAP